MISRLRSIMNAASFIQTSSGLKIKFPGLVQDIQENRRIVYFGEIHSVPKIIEAQKAVLESMTEAARVQSAKVHLILEHFSIDDQTLLDNYMSDNIKTEQELIDTYEEQSSEGHDIKPYSTLFQYAKNNSSVVNLRGGFVPRQYARILVKDGEDVAYNAAKENNYLEDVDIIHGSEEHYNYFESLISGRDVNSDAAVGENFRRIFPAQIIKDCVMSSVIRRCVQSSPAEDKFLILAGMGHLDHRFGVPERVDSHSIVSRSETCIITVRDVDNEPENVHACQIGRVERFGEKYPGDFIFLFSSSEAEQEEIKSEISAAYDKVGSSAGHQGDLVLAGKVMRRLGYTDQQISEAGTDAYNYQGVGCPHTRAGVRAGDQVLDLGSGLGVDSFIAAAAARGNSGAVVGLDISKQEVEHARTRAAERGLDNVRFEHGDMERMTFSDNSFDVVISNGAFCLAPNKEAAFREIFRVLKPGGRFSVCCTTTRTDLDSGVEWPICMRVFMPLSDTRPMLENIGFTDIVVDDSDSKMTFDDDDLTSGTDDDNASDERRYRIHGNTPEFQHLENFDMNQLCARVVLYGIKPIE